jgi:hypothetical protein
MVFRAIICSAALIFGLLATLSVTAQSAGAPPPLNLMNFMQGSAKAGSATKTATASTSKHRRAKIAARPLRELAATPAASAETAVMPAAAAAYASQSNEDVQVVSGDEVNAIDLAMDNSASETNGTSIQSDSGTRDRFKPAEAAQFGATEDKPDSIAAAATQPATSTGDNTSRAAEIARESWINRFWSALGDGFVALTGMMRQLFG